MKTDLVDISRRGGSGGVEGAGGGGGGEEERGGGGGGGGGRRLEAREEVGALPALPPSYSEAVAAGAVFKDDPPKYSDIQK